MIYNKYPDTTLEEIQLFKLLYARMSDFKTKECTYTIRSLVEAFDKRFNMNKDKLNKLLNDLEKRGLISIIEKGRGMKESKLRITIDDVINK